MKITYEFNTDDENFSRDELLRVQKADDMAGCIWDIEQKLRKWYKYDSREAIPVEEIREEIFNIIKEHEVNTDRLYR